jgi:hypothetical protein
MFKTKTRKRPKSPKKTTRVTVDIPSEKHKRLKAVAALKGETLQEFILTCVDEKMHESNSKTKLEQLEELGLVGAIEESEITSTNYKKFIKKSIKAKHERDV